MSGTHVYAKMEWSRLEFIPSREPDNDGDCVRNIYRGDGHGEDGVDCLFACEDEETECKCETCVEPDDIDWSLCFRVHLV